ncbi:MAG: MarC family protein [Deltaproteobacteria bacterium]|nr:MarC family protein [Deltaproteobacteria bacterium]
MNYDITNFLLALIPVFVAMDAIAVLPIFLSMIEGMPPDDKKIIIKQSVVTAFLISVCFLAVGKFIFSALGITVADFKIAGGIVLLVLAINDLLFPEKTRRFQGSSIGVVPLGMPLIVGPGVLTTIIILVDTYGYLPALFSILVNLFIVWLAFNKSDAIMKILGENGAKGFSKVMSIFLAAIAVMMIRRGIFELINMGW